MPLVDWFLYDYKAKSSLHQKLTGVEDTLILENLSFLCAHGAKVILRCPIVPDINEDEAALQAHIARYPRIVRVERLPYHSMGVHKSLCIGDPVQRNFNEPGG